MGSRRAGCDQRQKPVATNNGMRDKAPVVRRSQHNTWEETAAGARLGSTSRTPEGPHSAPMRGMGFVNDTQTVRTPSPKRAEVQFAFKVLVCLVPLQLARRYRLLLRSSSIREPRHSPTPNVRRRHSSPTGERHCFRTGPVVRPRGRPIDPPRPAMRAVGRGGEPQALTGVRPRSDFGGFGYGRQGAASKFDNDLAAGSPTATLLRLLLPLVGGHRMSSEPLRRLLFYPLSTNRLEATTGGVYKWQGRNQCDLMNRTY